MTARHGKIGRLPKTVRETLNRRLENGETGPQLASWLNALPEVQAVLAADFSGQPVNEQNISAWRQGGFQDWLRHQEARDWTRRFAEEAADLNEAAKQMPLAEHLATLVALALGRVLREVAGDDGDPAQRRRVLWDVTHALVRLRRGDHQAARLRVEQERWEAEQEAGRAQQQSAAQLAPLTGLILAGMLGDLYENKAKETGRIPAELLAFLAKVAPEAARAAGVPVEQFQKLDINPNQGESR